MDTVDVVRGRTITRTDGALLRAAVEAARFVVVDVGTGDGRWVYRTARMHPDWLCVGVDANADGLRETSRRAARRTARGGAPNAWFIRARVEEPPAACHGIADEIRVHYPWRGLLHGLIEPRPAVLAALAALGTRGARLTVTINASALDGDFGPFADDTAVLAGQLMARLAQSYAAAGITIAATAAPAGPVTTWGRRLGQGRSPAGVTLSGRIHASSEGRNQVAARVWEAGNK